MQSNNNPLAEIGAIVLALALFIAASILLFVGKIDLAGATSLYVIGVGLFAGNLALKAPSPQQQAQLHQLVQAVLSPAVQPPPQAPPVGQAVEGTPAPASLGIAPQFKSTTFEQPIVPRG